MGEIYSNQNNAYRNCAGINRGDVYSVTINRDGDIQVGEMVVVSPLSENADKPYVIMVNLADELKGRPRNSRVKVLIKGQERYVICETIKKVSYERLLCKVCSLSDFELEQLNDALAFTVGVSQNNKDSKYKILYDDLLSRYFELLCDQPPQYNNIPQAPTAKFYKSPADFYSNSANDSGISSLKGW